MGSNVLQIACGWAASGLVWGHPSQWGWGGTSNTEHGTIYNHTYHYYIHSLVHYISFITNKDSATLRLKKALSSSLSTLNLANRTSLRSWCMSACHLSWQIVVHNVQTCSNEYCPNVSVHAWAMWAKTLVRIPWFTCKYTATWSSMDYPWLLTVHPSSPVGARAEVHLTHNPNHSKRMWSDSELCKGKNYLIMLDLVTPCHTFLHRQPHPLSPCLTSEHLWKYRECLGSSSSTGLKMVLFSLVKSPSLRLVGLFLYNTNMPQP